MLLLVALVACGGEPAGSGFATGSSGGSDDGTASACPEGMISLTQNRQELGEWDLEILDSYAGTVIPQDTYSTDPVCISRFPMPGVEAAPWPVDGLSLDQLPAMEQALARYGRRLCTVPELLLGAAGEDDWRHPYDPEERSSEFCDPDDFNPQPVGAYVGCESPMGLRDVEVRSSWGLLDDTTRANLAEVWADSIPGDGVYAVWGGTSRDDTYYAPSNFGVHFHGEGEEPYTDDSLRVCADPGVPTSGDDQAWAAAMRDFVDVQGFEAWLSLQ